MRLLSFALLSLCISCFALYPIACNASAVPFGGKPIVFPSTKFSTYDYLVVFVPGGKVPPQNYSSFINATMMASETRFLVTMPNCGQLHLCDPLGELNSEINAAIAAGEHYANRSFDGKHTFIFGHSLGGVGARHYVDVKGEDTFAGLALLGTQYNGDHEDFKGPLGYPNDLSSFPIPLLALLGELDMLPISHAAVVFDQTKMLAPPEMSRKPVLVVPGMDHSQFCSPFHVAHDIVPEISDEAATSISGGLAAAWIDVVALNDTDSADYINGYMEKNTLPILSPFLLAQSLEKSEWCRTAQRTLLKDLPLSAQLAVNSVTIDAVDGEANLEHGRVHYSYNSSLKTLSISNVEFPYYPVEESWNPFTFLSPTYVGARGISCKSASADRVAKEVNATGYYPQSHPKITCQDINKVAVDTAWKLLESTWPAATKRFNQQGRPFQYEKDKNYISGLSWVWASKLNFDEKTDPNNVLVTSSFVYSPVDSPIFPGVHYCKVLSPAKAIEWIQTRGLTKRYP